MIGAVKRTAHRRAFSLLLEKKIGMGFRAVSTSKCGPEDRKESAVLSGAAAGSGGEVGTSVADADFVRRQNRGLILSTLRREGPMSRTQLAGATGLSSRLDHGDRRRTHRPKCAGRRRREGAKSQDAWPAGGASHFQPAGLPRGDRRTRRQSRALLAGRLCGHVGRPHREPGNADALRRVRPATFIRERIERLPSATGSAGNGAADCDLRAGHPRSRWRPTQMVADRANERREHRRSAAAGVRVRSHPHKRGRLLAEGARVLYPGIARSQLAAVFIGSTVAMGMSFPPPLHATTRAAPNSAT